MDSRIQGVIYYLIGLSLQSIKKQINAFSVMKKNEIFEDCLTIFMPHLVTELFVVQNCTVSLAFLKENLLQKFSFLPFK